MPATSLLFNTPALTPILPNTTPRPSGGAAGADDVAPRDDVDGALDDDDDASAQPTSSEDSRMEVDVPPPQASAPGRLWNGLLYLRFSFHAREY